MIRGVAVAAIVTIGACEVDASPPAGTCAASIWGRAERSGTPLFVSGSWNDWGEPRRMAQFGDGWQLLEIDLPPGEHGYLVVEEGEGRLDRYQPLTTFRTSDDLEVSLLRVPDCGAPQISVASVQQVDAGAYAVTVQVTKAQSGADIDPAAVQGSDAAGPLEVAAIDEAAGTIELVAYGRPRGKHRATITVADREGAMAQARVATAWIDPVAPTWADGIVYQVMIDRFRGDGGAVLDLPSDPGARAGGTLDGIRSELDAIEALGVSALWLSPVYVNPVEARPGRDDEHLYEGYHGYWPLDSRGVESRIGGAQALQALVADAHARGIRVLLDLVPNHYYEANPRVAEHRAQGWFHEHDEPCVCGSTTCPWSTFIETCWFTDYLPDLRFEHPDVMATAVADAVWWHETFATDGVRIDAVPMMPRAVTRRIVADLRRSSGTADGAFTLGEIFTGGGDDGTAAIRWYMGPDGLDSAFDFPLMWALRDAIAHEAAGFDAVEASLLATDVALEGSGAVMARMIGNHDVPRFASEIAGDAGSDAWSDPPAQPSAAEVYERQALALGVVLTLPGLPVIYYGDETGLAGASDPDNRRVMPHLEALAPDRAALLDRVRRLAATRRCLPALRTGTRTALVATSDHWAFVRDAGDTRSSIVLASRRDEASTIPLPASPLVPAGTWVDAVDGERFVLGAEGAEVAMPPRSLRVLLREGDPCA